MTVQVVDTGPTERTITGISVLDATMLRDCSQMWVRDSNNVSRLVFSTASTLSVSVISDVVGGIAYGTGVVTTDPALAIAADGVPPYTYAWTTISHTNATPPNVDTPTTDDTTFTQTGVSDVDSAVFRCTVTDDVSATATVDVTAFFQNVVPPFP